MAFFLNGEKVTIADPSPQVMLIDYLRSPKFGLAGPKKPCGQGGCGGCTVILSDWDETTNAPQHRAINSCLRPVAALNGLVVTTIEGTGSVPVHRPETLGHTQTGSRHAARPGDPVAPALADARISVAAAERPSGGDDFGPLPGVATDPGAVSGVNPVAWRLAMNNGSQCGYCSVGFVMSMSEFLANHPEATKREIEGALDGNICRCTGYRSILTGMKTFASDWTAEDERHRMKCLPDPETAAIRPDGPLMLPFPDAAKAPATSATIQGTPSWLSPGSLRELCDMMRAHPKRRRLVAGNTGYGVYKTDYVKDVVLLNLSHVPELHEPAEAGRDALRIPATMTYTDLIACLERTMEQRDEPIPGQNGKPLDRALSRLGALHFMAHRTAGRVVRNAATVGGNCMLMLNNIHGNAAPFPSDMATAMAGVGATARFVDARDGAEATQPLEDLVRACVEDPVLPANLVLIAFDLPYGEVEADLVLPQKVALREINAHSIVNLTSRLVVGAGDIVTEAVLPFGALAPFPWRAEKTEAALIGGPLSLDRLPELTEILMGEVTATLDRFANRMAGLLSEGFTDAYRTELACAYLTKAVVNALITRDPNSVPENQRSAGDVTWGCWPVSAGRQTWSRDQDWKAPVALPYIKRQALNQAMGRVHYAHELPVPHRTVNAAPVQGARALALWHFRTPDGNETDAAGLVDILRGTFRAFVDLATRADVPAHGIN
ncbi:MAG: 2Fe-2S iron-sulfur cluster-binding protein, partial [Pseudomonadota bacterium]